MYFEFSSRYKIEFSIKFVAFLCVCECDDDVFANIFLIYAQTTTAHLTATATTFQFTLL
jgi:hypothetical protein